MVGLYDLESGHVIVDRVELIRMAFGPAFFGGNMRARFRC